MELRVKKLKEDAKLPTNNWPDAGWDLYCVADEDFIFLNEDEKKTFILAAGESHIFKLGIATVIPEGYTALFWDRSGMGAKKEIHRFAGVIDAGYRGEWMVKLVNLGHNDHTITEGDKIVQCIFQEVTKVDVELVDELEESERGEGGFGSTGN